jgi:hypothetical protein
MMKQTKEILTQLESIYTNIDYYHLIVEKIEDNVDKSPDISIESCKSLIEGLSKFILRQLDTTYDSSLIDKLDFHPLFKKSFGKLSEYCEFIEEDFINRLCSLIHLIGELRNKRGDISHGKLSPKEITSDVYFANMVMQVTDGLVFYMLNCFSGIEVQKELEYEDNPEFNARIDEENSFGTLSYSKALFDQDIEAYRQELLDYLDSLETNNENGQTA